MLSSKFVLLSLCALPCLAIHLNPGKGEWNGPKIVCTGWKKTGTSSIKRAYRAVGLMSISDTNMCKTPNCLDKYDATQDAYTCCSHSLVKKMADHYPADKVKFIHLSRNPTKWYKSVQASVQSVNKGKSTKFAKMYSKLMGANIESDSFVKKYIEHNAFIRNLFAKEPERLLVLDLEEGNSTQNMMNFCKFVGVDLSSNPLCSQPFPHWNSNTRNKAYASGKKAIGITPQNKTNKTSLKELGSEDSLEDSKGVSDKWLHVDEDPTEFDDFDWDVVEKDWMLWKP